MDDDFILILLKQDLQLLHNKNDDYLKILIQASQENIKREGITLDDSYSHCVVVAQYAAWLYRKRMLDTSPMPRMLRYSLNNILIQQKAGKVDV